MNACHPERQRRIRFDLGARRICAGDASLSLRMTNCGSHESAAHSDAPLQPLPSVPALGEHFTLRGALEVSSESLGGRMFEWWWLFLFLFFIPLAAQGWRKGKIWNEQDRCGSCGVPITRDGRELFAGLGSSALIVCANCKRRRRQYMSASLVIMLVGMLIAFGLFLSAREAGRETLRGSQNVGSR